MPVIIPLERIAEFGAGLIGGDGGVRMHAEELQVLVDVSAREGVLGLDEGEMISDIIRISDVRISELMVPRVEMVSFNLADPVEDLMGLFRESKLTMMPVYDRTKDNMRGLVHVKDVLLMAEDQLLVELVRPVPFLPETATAEEALTHCRDRGSKTAFVVDEHGAVLGLVTLEDLLEEIVGEIDDEFDDDTPPDVEDLGEGCFRVRGGLTLREWEEEQGWQAPEMDVDTVGGLIMALLDRMPQEGDSVRCNGLVLTVETTAGRRVETVMVERDPHAQTDGQDGDLSGQEG
jgi:CBS domain containing-hemolysin-like protein